MHATEHRGCKKTVRRFAQKADPGRQIPRRTSISTAPGFSLTPSADCITPPTHTPPPLPQAGSLGCLKEQPTTLYMGSANKYAKLKWITWIWATGHQRPAECHQFSGCWCSGGAVVETPWCTLSCGRRCTPACPGWCWGSLRTENYSASGTDRLTNSSSWTIHRWHSADEGSGHRQKIKMFWQYLTIKDQCSDSIWPSKISVLTADDH